jgi:hypothetical protein
MAGTVGDDDPGRPQCARGLFFGTGVEVAGQLVPVGAAFQRKLAMAQRKVCPAIFVAVFV